MLIKILSFLTFYYLSEVPVTICAVVLLLKGLVQAAKSQTHNTQEETHPSDYSQGLVTCSVYRKGLVMATVHSPIFFSFGHRD